MRYRTVAALAGAALCTAALLVFAFQESRPTEVHAAESSVTWFRDVAPVVYRNCTGCHHTGGSGPFSLLTYRDAQRWGGLMETVTASRYMPPWLPEPGHGEFQDSRRLPDADIATIKAWVDAGMPQGDAATAPPAPVYSSEWQLGPPDLILQVSSPTELPASGPDVFLNFILPSTVPATRWVRAMEIKPGSPRVVHHANVILDRTASLRRTHPADWQRGIPGMDITIDGGSQFDPDSHFLFWKPDSTALVELDSMPWRLDPGNDLLLNMHLKATGKVEHIQARIGLYFSKTPATQFPMLLQLEHDAALDIPAGDGHFTVEDSLKLPEAVDVLAVYPHAHYLGKRLEGFATLPDGETKWLVLVPDWDIERQAVYRLRVPMRLPAGTELRMRYTYDNSKSNPRNPHTPPVRVHSGNASTDEMGHLWLQVLPVAAAAGDARLPLQRAWMDNRLRKDPADSTALFNLASIEAESGEYSRAEDLYRRALETHPDDLRILTALGSTELHAGETAAAVRRFQQVLLRDPHATDARFDLAKIELTQGSFAEAEKSFHAVLQDNAADLPARNGLGSALLAQDRITEAAEQFSDVLKSDPANFDALYNKGQIAAGSGETQQAEQLLRRAIAVQPDADAERTLAILLASESRFQEALPHMEAAARLAPDDTRTQALLQQLRSQAR